MTSYGLPYQEYLEIACGSSGSVKYKKRYRGRQRTIPDPISKSDAAIVRKYLDERTSEGLKPATAKVVATYLCMIARNVPGYDTMDTDKARLAFQYLRNKMKQNTQRRAIPVLKNFIRYLNEEKINTSIDLGKIAKIKTPKLDTKTKKTADMLTGKEIQQLVDIAGNERDRAIIGFMFEGALRPIEVSVATWGDLNFDQYGASFNTSEKTGKPRYIRLIWSGALLKAWANKYPGDPSGDNPIFPSTKNPGILKPIETTTIRWLFYRLLKRAGIKKQISVYYLRHSRISSMLKDEGIPESVIKLQAWGSPSSNMLATYLHLSNNDMDRILLTKAGVVTSDLKKEDTIRPRQCPNCGKVHGPTTKFCDECGTCLSEEAKQSIQTATAAIRKELSPEEKKAALASMTKDELLELMAEIAATK